MKQLATVAAFLCSLLAGQARVEVTKVGSGVGRVWLFGQRPSDWARDVRLESNEFPPRTLTGRRLHVYMFGRADYSVPLSAGCGVAVPVWVYPDVVVSNGPNEEETWGWQMMVPWREWPMGLELRVQGAVVPLEMCTQKPQFTSVLRVKRVRA